MSKAAMAIESVHGTWRNRWTFVLAATGSAVGLGNIWKFPYIAGENGGGAFVIFYLLCIALIGIPIMVAEVVLGRHGRHSPINTMRLLAQESELHPSWVIVGWMGALAGFLILTFYSVIAGWSLDYIFKMASGTFSHATSEQAGKEFTELLANPLKLTIWHTIFMVLAVVVIARGVNKGLSKAIRILMPMLFVLLFILFGFSLSTGAFGQAWDFLFAVDFSKLKLGGMLIALGHAFFTLSLGLGAIMAYGAYMPKSASIGRTVLIVAGLDTLVAILAGLIIFSLVFANGLEAAEGPGLMFVTLPLAFGNMVMGQFLGMLFFVLVTFAAWSSAISLLEPIVAWLVESLKIRRMFASILIGALAWFIGLGTVFSFNIWSDMTIWDKTVFDMLDFLTANIMLPLGGVLIAIFAGWKMNENIIKHELKLSRFSFKLWRALVRVVAPVGVVLIFINTMWPDFFPWLFELN